MANEIDVIKRAFPSGDGEMKRRKANLLDEWVAQAENGYLAHHSMIKSEFPDKYLEIVGALTVISQDGNKNSYQTPFQGKKRKGDDIDGDSVDAGARTDLLRTYIEPKGSVSAVDLLDEGIDRLIKDSDPGNKMAPFLFLMQSMGYGKTRAMLELAKNKRRAVYLPCKDTPTLSGDNKFWKVPSSLKEMLRILHNQEDESLCEIKWIKFLQAVERSAAAYETPAELYQAQVTKAGTLGEFYNKLCREYFPSPILSRNVPRSAVRRGEKSQNAVVSIAEEDEICYKNAKAINGNSLVVCLDEATALAKPSFRAFRRAAKHLGIIIIFSDTTASISEIMPARDSSATLEGGELGHFTAPMYQISNFDLEWDFRDDPQDLANLFKAGRPRWSSLLQAIQKENTNANQSLEGDRLLVLVQKVAKLLARDDSIEEVDRPNFNGPSGLVDIKNILPNMVAIFACRFGLGSRSKIAPLLAKYSLATVDHVAESRDVVSTHYPSEPVLAEASAHYTRQESRLMQVLKHVHAAVLENLLTPPRGDLGEMCAAALMGLTMDKIRSGKREFKFFSEESVELKEFLSYFGCKDTDETSAALEGWELNFTHFVRPPYNLDHNDLEIMWNRRMAYYVLQGMKGLDLLITMYHKEKGHATMRVQVKNYAAHFTDSKRSEALGKLAPRYCPPAVPEEKFSVGLLLCVGSVNDYCALVDYDNVNQTVWPCPGRCTRQHSTQKAPQKLFLQIASSFLGTGHEDKRSNNNIAKKLWEICRGSETSGDWDVSKNSIESCKREICKCRDSS